MSLNDEPTHYSYTNPIPIVNKCFDSLDPLGYTEPFVLAPPGLRSKAQLRTLEATLLESRWS